MPGFANISPLPHTEAVRRVLRCANDAAMAADLLFLEAWEMNRTADLGTTLRAGQIRRANPGLAAEIQAELAAAMVRPPLTIGPR
ncbi:MAG: hypothetical protein P4L71_15320 [Acetobacteraceae bacterium]|nr:hypothetical protein [Acetobacteraceae bacterium]